MMGLVSPVGGKGRKVGSENKVSLGDVYSIDM